jgi:hypothetical protein
MKIVDMNAFLAFTDAMGLVINNDDQVFTKDLIYLGKYTFAEHGKLSIEGEKLEWYVGNMLKGDMN